MGLKNVIPIVLALVLAILIINPAKSLYANHAGSAHNYFIHSSVYHEWVCVDATGSSISTSIALDRVKNTLRYGNPSSDWHALAGNRIYFEFENLSCGSLTSNQFTNIKMRVYVKNDTSPTSVCGNANVSCVKHYNPVHTHNGYTDYGYQVVYLKTSHINSSAFWYHHTIGHEFGHTLGLADPINCAATSIMHSGYYGCTDYEWPTTSDRTSVTNVSNMYTVPGG